MKRENICKIPIPSLPNTLSVTQFVWETDPQTMQAAHRLDGHRMLLIAEGSGVLHFDQHSCPCTAGDLFFGFLGESFSVSEIRGLTYLYLTFAGTRADELLRRFDLQAGNRHVAQMDALLPLWRESLSRADEQVIDLAAESVLLYTLSRLPNTTGENRGLVGEIMELTEQSFCSPNLSLSLIAQELSYNPKYLSRLFREKAKITYTEYLRSVRIKHAIILLDHGLDSIKNVALLCGFSDPLYFSAVFRSQVGLSPTEYLKQKEPHT